MNIFKTVKDLFVSPPPHICVEFSPERLTMVILNGDTRNMVVKECRERPLAKGMLTASFHSRNIQDVKGLKNLFEDLYGAEKRRPNRLGIVLPDSIAKISLVKLESVPKNRTDLDSLIRWSIAKSIPFDLDEAQISYSLQKVNDHGDSQFIVLTSRRDVILEYEQLCASIGLKAGLIVPSSIAVTQLLFTSSFGAGSGDCLFVKSSVESGSVAILREGNIAYFKNLPSGSSEDLGALVHQTNMYYEDRLQGKHFRGIFYLGQERDQEASDLQKSILFPLVDLSEVIDVTGNEMLQGLTFCEKSFCAASVGMLCGLNN